MLVNLPDIQTTEPKIKIPIRQVGVENIKSNIILESKHGGCNKILSSINMSTNLHKNIKGISMSMLYRTLQKYLDIPLKHELILQILNEFKTAVETNSNDSFIRFNFEYPINKIAPISKLPSTQFYSCSFEGRMTHDNYRFFIRYTQPYSSYCPCSASLCDHLQETTGNKGFPHAQRSNAYILVEWLPNSDILWLEDLIELVERSIKTFPIAILRRSDEQEYGRIAYENPMFVEDAIRIISNTLNSESRIYDWIVRCVHFESIHTHEAVAINWKGIENGFDGLLFL